MTIRAIRFLNQRGIHFEVIAFMPVMDPKDILLAAGGDVFALVKDQAMHIK